MNAVDYAEQVLHVHDPWIECQQRLADHSTASILFLDAGQRIRSEKQELEDREFDLITIERGTHPDMKVQEFGRHMKVVMRKDSDYQEHVKALRQAEDDRAEAEAKMKHAAHGIGALSARMHELGGLLTFYAAAKQETVSGSPDDTVKP